MAFKLLIPEGQVVKRSRKPPVPVLGDLRSRELFPYTYILFMYKCKILVVDVDPLIRGTLERVLGEWGYDLRLAAEGMDAQETLTTYDPDLVIADVATLRLSGLDLVRALKSGDPSRPVILITANASIDLAVESMKQGAQDFLTKPIDYPKLEAILKAAEADIHLRRASRKLSSQLEQGSGFGNFIGISPVMRAVYESLQRVGTNMTPALITGESGTGKELAARTIHQLSSQSSGPFVAINAGAIPETLIESQLFGHEKGAFTGAISVGQGCFELARGGTLFLDEIAEMPIALQPKLLRVLEDGKVRRLGGNQEHPFDVRILAGTNRNPQQAIRDGRLREDLYYRLTVFTVTLPPLREHKSDIPLLAVHFIREFNRKHSAGVGAVRDEAMDILLAYSWPGNVREFRNVMERAVILARGEWIESRHLPPYLPGAGTDSSPTIVFSERVTAAEAERQLILRTLERTGQNKAEAARQLGLDVKTIRNKLKAYKGS
jgi:DNA-binding NtrC family response regulator